MSTEPVNEKHIFGINPKNYFPKKAETGKTEDFSPLPWSNYFDKLLTIRTDGLKPDEYFRAYASGKDSTKPAFVFLHGAGMSSLSFALLAKRMKNEFFCFAFDFRGHGDSQVTPSKELSTDTLVEDANGVIKNFFKGKRKLVVVGHSLGGAIGVKLAEKYGDGLNIAAVGVIDLTEGSALASLSIMTDILQQIPTSFGTLEQAIEWNVRQNASRSLEAARVAIPARLVCCKGGDEFVWRTNLFSTRNFWRGWFEGMSDSFLNLAASRLLILADTDRLDKPLTIAQMQGKFQLEILPGSGHEVHENNAPRVADILCRFVERNRNFDLIQ